MTAIPPSRELPIEAPIVVLSDLHLGHPASFIKDPAEVIPLLGPAKTAIFNGDTFEQLNLERCERAGQMMTRLLELCHARGVRPYMLTGNHDPRASSLHYLDLFDGRVFLTHGDGLHDAVAPWSREAPAVLVERKRLLRSTAYGSDIDHQLLLTKQTELVAALYDHKTPPGIIGQSSMVAKFAIKPWRIIYALTYWSRVVHYSREFTHRYRPSTKLFLIGHTHRAGVWMSRDMTVVNTGSFQPLSRPLIVHMNDQKAVIHRTKYQSGAYHLAEGLHHVDLT